MLTRKELDEDFIGSQDPLTEEEELALRKNKLLDKKPTDEKRLPPDT